LGEAPGESSRAVLSLSGGKIKILLVPLSDVDAASVPRPRTVGGAGEFDGSGETLAVPPPHPTQDKQAVTHKNFRRSE